jgi:hypothetical protein
MWSNNRPEPAATDNADDVFVNDWVLMTSVFSRLNLLRVLYALYLALDELVPGQPAFGSATIVCVSFSNVHCVGGPAMHVGVVVVSSYTRVRPVTSEFLSAGVSLMHGSNRESTKQDRFWLNVLKLSYASHLYLDEFFVDSVLSPGHRLHPYMGSALIFLQMSVRLVDVFEISPMRSLYATFLTVLAHDFPTLAHVSLANCVLTALTTMFMADSVLFNFSKLSEPREVASRVCAIWNMRLIGRSLLSINEIHGFRSRGENRLRLYGCCVSRLLRMSLQVLSSAPCPLRHGNSSISSVSVLLM